MGRASGTAIFKRLEQREQGVCSEDMEAKEGQWAGLWLSLQGNAALVGFDEESDQELQYSGVSRTKSR